MLAADVEGDGRDDVVGMLRCAIWQSGYVSRLMVALAQPDGSFVAGPSGQWRNDNDGCNAVDVDGDRRDDLVCEDSTAKVIRTYLSRPEAWDITQTPSGGPAPGLADYKDLQIRAVDVDGDGQGDVILAQPTPADTSSNTRIIFGRSKGGRKL